MDLGANTDPLPRHLRSTYQLIKASFPEAIDPESYLSLLALLGEKMSDRNLADVVACALGVDYARALHDVYGARSTAAPSAEAVEKVRQRLLSCGYEKWLQEE